MTTSQKQRTLKVVICHAPEDRFRARRLYEQVRVVGVVPWMAGVDLQPGQDVQLETSKQIRQADAILILLSRSALEKAGSFWRELKKALDSAEEQQPGAIYIIPVRLEECEIPE